MVGAVVEQRRQAAAPRNRPGDVEPAAGGPATDGTAAGAGVAGETRHGSAAAVPGDLCYTATDAFIWYMSS